MIAASLPAEYMLDRLKMMCEDIVSQAVSEDNVAQLLEVSERYCARRLRAACMACVAAHPDLLQTEAFFALPAQLQRDVRAFLLA